jgi:hypothetical protein
MDSAPKKPASPDDRPAATRRIRIDAAHQPIRRPWLSLLRKR